MNILYISKIDGAKWSGPSYSVPEQICNQKIFDNVFWINLCITKNKWNELDYYRCGEKVNIETLPAPFNHPDVAIVEQFYSFALSSIFLELFRLNIPYIIIPRGEFTNGAQKQKKFKKKLANKIYLKKYIDHAIAIQYLTQRELDESKLSKNTKGIVIPNGISITKKIKHTFSKNTIELSYIGRIDFNHKGLDLLIDACIKTQKQFRENNCHLTMYGPDRDGNLEKMKKYLLNNKINDIVSFADSVVYEEKINVLLRTDVFIMTSRFEGLPMALVEAMSYGIPCFVTEGTNMRKEIEMYNAGWGAETNVYSIAETLLNMIRERNVYMIKSKNALTLAQNYDWKRIAEESSIKYRELVNSRG